MREIKVSSSVRKEQERNEVDGYLQALVRLILHLNNLLLDSSGIVLGSGAVFGNGCLHFLLRGRLEIIIILVVTTIGEDRRNKVRLFADLALLG